MKGCELCHQAASMYCESDDASLCWDCDARVHGANFLVARHARVLLCKNCQAPTPWRASGTHLRPTNSSCENCGDKASSVGEEEWEEDRMMEDDEEDNTRDGDGSDDDDDDGDDDYNDDDDDDDDNDGDNQVVPWNETPPPPASSSSGDESSSSETSYMRWFRD